MYAQIALFTFEDYLTHTLSATHVHYIHTCHAANQARMQDVHETWALCWGYISLSRRLPEKHPGIVHGKPNL